MRRVSLLLLTAVVCLAMVSTALAVPRGVLTATEYNQLHHAQTTLKRIARGERTPNWGKLSALCGELQGTSLLDSESVDCAAQFAELKAVFTTDNAVKSEPHCVARGGNALSCLLPAYENLDRWADRTYTADRQLRAVALARGFTGVCLDTVATTTKAIADDRRFASVMDRAVRAMQTANGPAMERLAPQLTSALAALLKQSGPDNLAVCKRQ